MVFFKQICPMCALDDDVEFVPDEDGTPVFVCSGRSGHHNPHEWSLPRPAYGVVASPRTGLGEELGVYDDLPAVLSPGESFVEYGVVEHRYAEAYPQPYRELVSRYGHTSLAPRRYTASAFLGKALGTLAHEGTLAVLLTVPATGRWAYNGTISAWARPTTGVQSGNVLSWATFASYHGIDPQDWPVTHGLGGPAT